LDLAFHHWLVEFWGDDLVVEALVRALPVVVGDELRDGTLERGFSNQNLVIQAVFAYGSDPSLSESVQVGRSGRSLDGLDSGSTQDQSELRREHLAAVADEVARIFEEAFGCTRGVPCDRFHPVARRLGDNPGCADLARGQTNDEVNVVADLSAQGTYFHGEEIRCRQYVPAALEELTPGALLVPLRRGFHAGGLEDLHDGSPPNLVPESGQDSLDLGVPPGGVLGCEPQDQGLYFVAARWSPGLSASA
jgi:hypothetical protein